MTGTGEGTPAESDPRREEAIGRLKAKQGFRNLAATALFVTILVNVIWLTPTAGTTGPSGR